MEPSDAALVLACRRGDTAAWEMLIARYQRLIYTIPRRAGMDDAAAADVFQHVWATLVEHLDRIEQPERIASWLVTTARRQTWRLSQRERTYRLDSADTNDEGGVVLLDDDPLPEEMVLRLEQQQRVRAGVMALNERCRTLLQLLFYQSEPPPYGEIAAALGTTEGSIGPTRARCLQKLRQVLETP